jgi:Ca2+-binding EF-hand superfamily protein
MIVLRIKKRLASKGTKGFLVFERAMKNVDTDEDGLITLDQFKQVVKDLKIDITNNETTLIFDVFDPDSTNLISYSEIIHTFKGEIS